MLRQGSSVTQVVVEGLHPDDETDFGKGPETFLGIDISEYHGGNRLATADKVVLSQLKCGVSHPERKWTFARLCRKLGSSRDSSVVGRLASAFSAVYAHDKVAAASKVTLQIVSNCPIEGYVRHLVRKSQGILRSLNLPSENWRFTHLKAAGLWRKDLENLELLHDASGLSSNGLCLFLNCLDLSTFEVDSPFSLRVRLIGDIRQFDAIQPEDGLCRLYDLIEESATKSKDKRPIGKEDVLNCLGTMEANFLPAPCYIQRPANLIHTDDCQKVAELLIDSQVRRVLVHGRAGIGKSATVTTVENLLPKGSLVVVFDCYAGGDTKTPDKFRFPEGVLCTQLVNELSLRANQDIYLIRNRASQPDFWGRLQAAIKEAGRTLAELSAILVLVVDAADNAVESYHRERDFTNDHCFLPKLWDLSLPSNVRLVMTCRTHRRDALQPPPNVKPYELKGFSPDDSLQYLQQEFPDLDETVARSFHQATAGVPRLQFYWLSELRGQTATQASREIKQRPSFGLDDLYDDWRSSAETVLPEGISATQMIALLRGQSSTPSLPVLSECLAIERSVSLRFCQGLEPGVLLSENRETLHFRDEDFESYLGKQLTPDDMRSAHDTLASYCLQTIERGGYGSLSEKDSSLKRVMDAKTVPSRKRAVAEALSRICKKRRRLLRALS
jgi:hypothetical protein